MNLVHSMSGHTPFTALCFWGHVNDIASIIDRAEHNEFKLTVSAWDARDWNILHGILTNSYKEQKLSDRLNMILIL